MEHSQRGDKDGYGHGRFRGLTTTLHRKAYCERHNLQLADIAGLQVCHHCDNPRCINPDHLFLGTNADNMRDKMLKGRAHKPYRDIGQANSKLTIEQVNEICMLYVPYDKEYGTAALGRRFGVDQSTISRVLKGKAQ